MILGIIVKCTKPRVDDSALNLKREIGTFGSSYFLGAKIYNVISEVTRWSNNRDEIDINLLLDACR